MRLNKSIFLLPIALILLFACFSADAQIGKQHTFKISGNQFLLDGKNFQIISGEMHYARIPKPYWRHRLKMAKAMGLNAICTYMFWNAHEPRPGKYNFSDNLDIAEFCKIAQEEGLWVIIRPGPYTCAEWDLGGLPAWLLKNKGVVLRSSDPKYMPQTLTFLKRAVKEFLPNLVTKGGNVLMVQVENEYGVYAGDKKYVAAIRDALLEAKVDVPLFHCDWAGKNYYDNAHVEGVMPSINFGGEAEKNFAIFEKYAPNVPKFNSEFWTGWFDYWGGKHEVHSVEEKLADFKWMVNNGISVNLYMFHGGTTNGFFPGANGSNTYYTPYTTSYDYDAPLSEDGVPNEKFFAFQKVIKDKFPELKLPSLPEPLPKITIPEFNLKPVASLAANLPKPQTFDKPQTMESLDQNSGYILYSHQIEGRLQGNLTIKRVMDRATVYIDKKKVGVLDRRLNQFSIPINVKEAGKHTLEILVEHQARVNFGNAIDNERKGITEGVWLNGKELLGWAHYALPLDNIDVFKSSPRQAGYPHLYQATFNLDKVGDTYLDTRKVGKGLLWINGRHIGRYWFIGPQQTLFVPGCWLKQGQNEVKVLEMEDLQELKLKGIENHIWDTKIDSTLLHSRPGNKLQLSAKDKVHSGVLNNVEGWQEVNLAKTHKGRYICLESTSAYGDVPYTTIAELRIKNSEGKEIPREEYSIFFADSEELGEGNGLATLMVDNQPTTFWQTAWSGNVKAQPHQVIIDLGKEQVISGFKYLPRMRESKGRVKDFNFYISKQPFVIK